MYLKLNTKKLFTYKKKALFLILPVTILLAVGIIASSEASNIITAAEQSIFGTIAEQSRLIQLTKDTGATFGGRGGTFRIGSTDSSDEYKQTDLDKIKALSNVTSAQIVSNVPVSNVVATDLFAGKQFSVNSLATLDSELASQYTDQDFNYKEGDAIPVILNANSFIEQYQEWNGQTEIAIDFSNQRPGQATNLETSPFPIKSRAIDYDKNDLIGKEFTMNIGGLTAIQDYKNEPTSTGMKFVKLTQAEIDSAEATRSAAISPYWNYNQIKTPLSYKFKVVGVVESETQFNSFIPTAFAEKLMHDYVNNQVTARTTTAIATTDLNNTFKGLTFDGLELKQDMFAQFRRFGGSGGVRIEMGRPGQATAQIATASYDIPGLVVETDRAGTTTVGEYKNVDVYTATPRSGTALLVKVDSVYNRETVVKQLNTAGYAYQDVSKTSIISELKTSLNTVVVVITLIIVAMSVVVIIFTMGKFVSESKREIGIFRALGASKGQVKLLFLTQALLYVFIGYVLGAVAGIVAIVVASPVAKSWFDSFIAKTLQEAFSVVNPVAATAFMHINWEMLAAYSVGLLVMTVVIALIPATQASNMSPVEAIRGE